MDCKVCSVCQRNETNTIFYKSKTNFCVECFKQKQKDIGDRKREMASSYKEERGCKMCGYSRRTHPETFVVQALEFHHPKAISGPRVSQLISRKVSDERIKLEMDNCIVLCSRCHVEAHYK